MNKLYVQISCIMNRLKKDEKGASHFLEIAGGLILVAAIVSVAIPQLTTSITGVISKAVTQITNSF